MDTNIPILVKKHNIDKEKLERLLPKGTNHKVTDEIITMISTMEEDTGLFQDYMEESLLSQLPVLSKVKTDLDDYVNAIKYCNLKRNMSNDKAWEIVFPERVIRLQEKDTLHALSSHVAMYNKTDIVVKLDAQMMISAHIQYAPMFHAAVNKQFQLMNGNSADGSPVSAHVQHLAAKELREIAEMPEDNTIELKIGQSDDSKKSQGIMINKMAEIAKNQQELLRQGYSIEEVQRLNLVVEEVDDEKEYIDIEEE